MFQFQNLAFVFYKRQSPALGLDMLLNRKLGELGPFGLDHATVAPHFAEVRLAIEKVHDH